MGGYRVFFFWVLSAHCMLFAKVLPTFLETPCGSQTPNPQWTPASSGGIFLDSRSVASISPGKSFKLGWRIPNLCLSCHGGWVAGWLSGWVGSSTLRGLVVLVRGIWIRSKSWRKQKLTSPTSNSLWTEVWHIIVAQIKAATRKTFCLVCWIRVASAGLSLLEKICYVHLQLSKWAGENSHQMMNSIDPDDHSPRLHVIIAMKKTWFSSQCGSQEYVASHGFPHAPAGPRFELFNILDVAPLAAENSDWNFAVGSCLFLNSPSHFFYLPISGFDIGVQTLDCFGVGYPSV